MKTLAVVIALLCIGEPALAHHVMGGQTPAGFLQGLLSGLGHPLIGLDHLAAVIAVGCLAAAHPRGALLAVGYVVAMMIGAAAHIGEATVAGAEIFTALSVIALGLLLLRNQPLAWILRSRCSLLPGLSTAMRWANRSPPPSPRRFLVISWGSR
jgi:urease accessory protein